MNKAIYAWITPKGKKEERKTFLGKHIGNTIHREFPFSKAVLWQNKELSFDKRLLDYALETNVKYFVFSDPIKRISLKAGIKALQNNGYEEQYGEGTQWYFSKQLARKLSQQEKTPYVSREVVI
tara:strand:+ start:3186 stop:3557 length:372 start_codon:yes stop_codon:yes gene_type:complete